MAIVLGSATNYQTLADALFQAATNRSITYAAVAAGGSGYSVGNVLTITNGSGGILVTRISAQVVVTSVSGGAVTGVRIINGGVYAPVGSLGALSPWATTGAGSGCTLNVGITDNGWRNMRSAQVVNSALSATISDPGTSYVVGDVLTITGGSGDVEEATFEVTSIGGSGEVTGVALVGGGDYTTLPSNPVVVGGGSGGFCELTVTWGTAGSGAEREVILKGLGTGGTDEIYVGFRSYYLSALSSARNWELAGFSGFDVDLLWENQPGISFGRYDDATAGGCFVPLDNATVTYWMLITARRILCVFKIGTGYHTMHLGLLDPYSTDAESPYPMFVAGSTNDRLGLAGGSSIGHSSIANPQRGLVGGLTEYHAPAQFRATDGQWHDVYNGQGVGAARVARTSGTVVFPWGALDLETPSGADAWYSVGGPKWSDIIPQADAPGTATATLARTTNSPAALPVPVPNWLVTNSPSVGIIGQIRGLFFVDVRGGLVAEDTLEYSGVSYRIFQSGNQAEPWMHFAIEEA